MVDHQACARCATFILMGDLDRPHTLPTKMFLTSLPLADPDLRIDLAAELTQTTDQLDDHVVGPDA